MPTLVVELRPPVPEDFDYIAAHMRDADAAEIRAASGLSPHDAMRLAKLKYASTDTTVGCANGQPVCMFGTQEGSLMIPGRLVWLLSTEQLYDYRLAFLRRNRAWVEEKVQRYDLLRNYVHVKNTQAVRWLKWLKFTIGDPVEFGVRRELFYPFWRAVNV